MSQGEESPKGEGTILDVLEHDYGKVRNRCPQPLAEIQKAAAILKVFVSCKRVRKMFSENK